MNGSRLRGAFARLVNAETVAELEAAALGRVEEPTLLPRLGEHARLLGAAAHDLIGDPRTSTPPNAFAADLLSGVATAFSVARDPLATALGHASRDIWCALIAWLASRGFGGGPDVEERGRHCRERLYRWRVDAVIGDAFRAIGLDRESADRATAGVVAIHQLPMWRPGGVADASSVLESWLRSGDAVLALGGEPREPDGFDASAFRWFVTLTSWVAAVRLVEYPTAYGQTTPPILDWVTQVAAGLRARGR